MGTDPVYGPLLRRSLVALAVGALLVVLCYLFVDRPVAFFVHDHGVSRHAVLRWLTYPPPVVQAWAPAVLVALMARRAWGPLGRAERALLAAGVAIIVADQFRESLRDVLGRYWPGTWIDNNPSLLGDGAYGFLPFHGDEAHGSFPSGHMARTVAVVAPFWVAYSRWRWLGAAATVAVAVGLIGMNYHFVGDVIGGSLVGALVGTYAAYGCGLAALPSSALPGDSDREPV